MIQRMEETSDIRSVASICLTSKLKKVLGDIKMAKVNPDGTLLVLCSKTEQKDKVMSVKVQCGQEIKEERVVGERRGARGAKTGIPMENGEIGECDDNINVKRCNCRGDHTAADAGCSARKQEKEIQQVKTNQKVTCTGAIKICQSQRSEERVIQECPEVNAESRHTQKLIMDEMMEKLMIFSAYVINCTEHIKSKTESRSKRIARGAERHLNIKDIPWDMIQAKLNQGQGTSETTWLGTP